MVELNTGLVEGLLHLQGQGERLLAPVTQPEDLKPEEGYSGTAGCLKPLAEVSEAPVGQTNQ